MSTTNHMPSRPNPKVGGSQNLRAGPHGPGSPLYQELLKFSRDYIYFKEDFLGTTAAEAVGATKVWVYTETAAGPVDPAKLTPTAALQSHITMGSGVTDNANGNIATQKMFAAKHDPWIEIRFQEDVEYANATVEFAFGFVGAVPASAADILGDIDTPTVAAGVTDAAFFGVDTDQTLKTTACVTVGTSTAVGKTTISGAAPFTQPTVNTDITMRVELRCATANSSVSRAYFFINDQLVAERDGPDAEVLMSGVLQIGDRSGSASTTYTIDYIAFGQSKSGHPF